MKQDYLRTLIQKRSEVYQQLVPPILLIEEALEKEHWTEIQEALREMRKILRGALPFLTDQILYEFEQLEALVTQRQSQGVATQLAVFQVQFSKAIQNPTVQEVEEILSLPEEIRSVVQSHRQELQKQKEQKKNQQKAAQLAEEAAQWLQKGKHKKAQGLLQKAIGLDPERAVYHNDLGVLYAQQGKLQEARQAYEKAIELNQAHPEMRTPQWFHTYFNLAKVLVRLGNQILDQQRGGDIPTLQQGLELYQSAQQAFEEFVGSSPHTSKKQEALQWIEHLGREIQILEETLEKLQKIHSRTTLPEEEPSSQAPPQ